MTDESEPRHFAFVINPRAGRYHNVDLAHRIFSRFENQPAGSTAEVLLTDSAGHASDIARDLAARYGSRLVVVACGGDGTAGEVAGGLAGSRSAMGILPVGTANDFAKAALSTLDLDELLERIVRPNIRPIDVLRVDGHVCLNIASLGFDTMVQKKAAAINRRFRWLGSLSYPIAIAAALAGQRCFKMHYVFDTVDEQGGSRQVEGDASFILAAVCNGRYYGGGYNPAPGALLDDGLADICLVDNLPLYRVLALIPKYKNGRHLADQAIHYWRVTGGVIRSVAGDLPGNLDGEVFDRSEISFQVVPKGLRFAFC